jgi:hypothetical protein
MKSKFLQTLGLLFISTMVYAQDEKKDENKLWIGISSGYTHNHLSTSVSYRPFTTYENKGGFAVGLPVVYHVTDWFGVQTEFSVLQKNYKWTRPDYYFLNSIPYQNTINTYVQFPLIARFSFGEKELRGFCALGGFTGYWASGRIEGEGLNLNYLPYSYDKKYTFDKRRDNRLEYGFLVGFGLEYAYKNICNFTLEGRYYYSTSDLQKNYMLQQNPRYNDTYVIQASVLFGLDCLRSFIKK